ncbi:hypothetical protein HK103_005097 [Boothiomyces macroporosus]|uniref:Phosphatidylserine decarboxylase proenzyme 2 n=1 Tax=Boothiomyces macroporosus TaxID=261099 RepID=A0AAD5UFJ1_9FUNG|nr:hypothetical protein HK103_005097 [Boothiomyces macroporosus]
MLWDKDFLKSDFLGYLEFTIGEILSLFVQGTLEGEPNWYPLHSRTPKEIVSGDIKLQFSIMEGLAPTFKQILTSMNKSSNAELIATDDPADDLYFNHTFNVPNPDEVDDKTVGSLQTSLDGLSVVPEEKHSTEEVTLLKHSDLVGMLLIELIGAKDLPYEKNSLKTNFNCDPFAVVSYGKKTYRTKVIRHNLNPEWNQSIYLHLKKDDLANDWPITWCIYDYERFHKNNAICESNSYLSSIIEKCDRPVKNPQGPTYYKPVYLDFEMTNTKAIVLNPPKLKIQCSYIPYKEIRRNFWLSLLEIYGYNTPDGEKKIDKVSFVTMLDSIECNFSDGTINNMFAMLKKSPDDELTFAEAFEILELKIKPSSMLPEDASPLGIENERLMLIKQCPICKKPFEHRGDFDVVSHFALCSHGHLEKLDLLAMGGFLTQQYASLGWITKIFSYVTFGGLGIGKNSGQILYQDRATGQLVKEKMPTYIRLGIRLLYQVAGSKSAVESKAIKRFLKNYTIKQGAKFDSPASKAQISQFAAYHDLDLDEILDPIDSFQNFNEFFYRKLKPDARTLASADPNVVVSPADARTNVFQTVSAAQEFWIKGSKFNLSTLFGDDELASIFADGSMSISRLAPQDYHRFHFPVDGTVGPTKKVEGTYFTVNPMAVRTTVDVYTENVRTITIINSTHHGKVAYVCIGAMLVGSIVLTSSEGQQVQRMDEHGYFKFGGSTILLFFEKGRIEFDSDLLSNSATSLETLVKMGNSLGKHK